MIDRPARQSLAQLVRQLSVGSITIDEFERNAREIAVSSQDAGVVSVYDAADGFYSDEYPSWSDRLRGRCRLEPEVRRQLAIATLFLYSDAEYEWPFQAGYSPAPNFLFLLLCALTASAGLISLGLFPLLSIYFFVAATAVFFLSRWVLACQHWQWVDRQNEIGDFDVWPFIHRKDFDKARLYPKLLSGTR